MFWIDDLQVLSRFSYTLRNTLEFLTRRTHNVFELRARNSEYQKLINFQKIIVSTAHPRKSASSVTAFMNRKYDKKEGKFN